MNFSTLNITKEMIDNLELMGYENMTPIQEQSLPHILQGKDVIAQAKTGSGKTAAFGIGVLSRLNVKRFRVQSLILCPTRELADQVAKELRLIARATHNVKILTLCGGASFNQQFGSLKHEAHIIVGTPGRVLKHLKKGSLSLDDLEMLVLDEADRMLDMGFSIEIDEVLLFAKKRKQTLLFSATYTDDIIEVGKKIQFEAVEVKTISTEPQNKIIQRFYKVGEHQKIDTLIDIFSNYKPQNVIVFTNTKLEAKELASSLQAKKIDALAIHGDLEQYERNDVLVQFSNHSCPILVATDVAARGLDIKNLSMVVNYSLPHTPETYTHRIGRTGRASNDGLAFTFVDDFEMQELDDYKHNDILLDDVKSLKKVVGFEMKPQNITLVIEGGKKDKLRAGDILGALTKDAMLKGDDIGKIEIYDRQSYVAIKSSLIDEAEQKLNKSKIKGRKFSVWVL